MRFLARPPLRCVPSQDAGERDQSAGPLGAGRDSTLMGADRHPALRQFCEEPDAASIALTALCLGTRYTLPGAINKRNPKSPPSRINLGACRNAIEKRDRWYKFRFHHCVSEPSAEDRPQGR